MARAALCFVLVWRERGPSQSSLLSLCSKKEKIIEKALESGTRRKRISQVKSAVAYQLIEDFGLILSEIGRQMGVSASVISKALRK